MRFSFRSNLLRPALSAFVPLAITAASLPQDGAAATLKTKPDPAFERLRQAIAKIDAEAKGSKGEARVLQRLSDQLEVGKWDLKVQREAWGWTLGELAAAYAFVQASPKKKTLADIATMQSTRASWLDIAKEFGVKADSVAFLMKRHIK